MNRLLIAVLVLGVLATACQGTSVTSPSSMIEATAQPSATSQTESAPPSPSESLTQTASASPSPSQLVSASPSPSAAPEPGLAIFASAVNGLRLRAGPSLAADVVELVTGNPILRTLDAGQVVAALDGPIASDGFDWYLVQVVRGRPLLGWAATPQDGDAWLVPSELECPAAPLDLVATMAMGPAAALYCSD